MGIINLAILLSLIKALDSSENPLLCTVIYSFAFISIRIISYLFYSTIITDKFLMSLLIAAGVQFVLSFVYFFLLNKSKGSFWWWLILPFGIFTLA